MNQTDGERAPRAFGPEFQVSPGGYLESGVAMGSSGDFVIVWNGVTGQRFDSSG